ncbi:MAG: SIMPL domain-containing protein [Phycisphaerales bacterium]
MSTARIHLFWLIIFTCTLPLGVVFSTHLARKSFEKVKLRDQTITVKGYAEQPITSDLATWTAGIVTRNADRTAAYQQLEQQRTQLLAYLNQRGFAEQTVRFQPVDIEAQYKRGEKGERTNTIELYEVSQSFTIQSDKVQLIAATARDASELIGRGIELQAGSPRYLYTQLGDMKLEMIGKATTNAHERAGRLLTGSGNALGDLKSASQGVFQITPAYSTEVSGDGENDTSSIDKVIKAVVTVEYAIR